MSVSKLYLIFSCCGRNSAHKLNACALPLLDSACPCAVNIVDFADGEMCVVRTVHGPCLRKYTWACMGLTVNIYSMLCLKLRTLLYAWEPWFLKRSVQVIQWFKPCIEAKQNLPFLFSEDVKQNRKTQVDSIFTCRAGGLVSLNFSVFNLSFETGVYISKYSDCLDLKLWYDGKTGYIVLLKLTKVKR